MADIGNTTIWIGNSDWHIGDPISIIPNAELVPEQVRTYPGGFIRIDGSNSGTADDLTYEVLYFEWYIEQVPHKSSLKVGRVNPGPYTTWFEEILTLKFDVIGEYRVSLYIRGANGGLSSKAISIGTALASNSPLFENISLDTSWVWKTLPDFWDSLPKDDRSRIELLWRGLQQLVGSDLLNAYNIDDNKSIATIQDRIFRRWYPIYLDLDVTGFDLFINFKESYSATPASQDKGLGRLMSLQQGVEPIWTKTASYTLKVRFISTFEFTPLEEYLGEFYPQEFDVGSRVRITILDEVVDTEVIAVDFLNISQRGRTVFETIYSVRRSINLPEGISTGSVEITCSPTLPIPVVLKGSDSEGSGLVTDQTGLTLSFVRDCVHRTHNEVQTLPYLVVPNAERLGVSSGDLVYFKVSCVNTGKSSDLRLKVASVVSNVSLDSNVSDLVLLDTIKSSFTELLQTLIRSLNTDDVDVITQDLLSQFRSDSFKVRHSGIRWENNSNTTIVFRLNVLNTVLSYKIEPQFIRRLSRVRLDRDIINLVKLCEFVEDHQQVSTDSGGGVITDGNRLVDLGRPSLELLENRDFSIRKYPDIGFGAKAIVNDDAELFTLQTVNYNFILSGIYVGDLIVIDKGLGKGSYTVDSVREFEVDLSPLPNITPTDGIYFDDPNAELRIYPKSLDGEVRPPDYLEILPGKLINTYPSVLWAETAVEDNNKAIDLTFGRLLKFPYSDWYNRDISTDYRSVILGLYSAKMLGATLENMQRSVGVVSGVPYADERCRVVDIDQNAEIDILNGTSLKTRITVRSVDSEGKDTGRVRSYEIPSKVDDSTDPFTSGLTENIKLGNIVEQFELFGLGIAIKDLLTDSRGELNPVLDRNKFVVTLNVDSTNLNEGAVKFVYDFLFEIKPSYTNFILRLYKFLVDFINIDTSLFIKYRMALLDQDAYAFSVPEVYDIPNPKTQIVDTNPFYTLTTWFPKDGVVSIVSSTEIKLVSPTGGFTPESISTNTIVYSDALGRTSVETGYTTTFNSGNTVRPWIRGTVELANSNRLNTLPDYVVFRSGDRALYKVKEVVSSTELILTCESPTGQSLPVFNSDNTSFTVVRLISDIVYDGVLAESSSEGIYLVTEGIVHDNIAAGDEISFPEYGLNRRPVLAVDITRLENGTPAIFIHSDQFPRLTAPELTGPRRVVVRRPSVKNRDVGTFTLVKDTTLGTNGYSVSNLGVESSGISVGDFVKYNDIESEVIATFASNLWLDYSDDSLSNGDQISCEVSHRSGTGLGDDLDLTEHSIRTQCLVHVNYVRSYNLGIGPQLEEYASDLFVKLTNVGNTRDAVLENFLGTPADIPVIEGDLIRINTKEALSREPTTEGKGLYRITNVDGSSIKLAQPLPSSLDRYEVSFVR